MFIALKVESQAKKFGSLAYLRLADETGLERAREVPGGHNDKSEWQRETQAASDQTQESALLHNVLVNQYRNAFTRIRDSPFLLYTPQQDSLSFSLHTKTIKDQIKLQTSVFGLMGLRNTGTMHFNILYLIFSY